MVAWKGGGAAGAQPYGASVHLFRFAASLLTDPGVRHKFRAGYEECILEIRRFLATLTSASPATCDLMAARDRILSHLHERAREIADMELSSGHDLVAEGPARPSSPGKNAIQI